MNLITIDLGASGAAGKEASPFSTPTGNEPAQPGVPGFGQWMSSAFEQLGLQGQAGPVSGSGLPVTPSAAVSPPSGPERQTETAGAPGTEMVWLAPGMPMPNWPEGLTIKQVSTGADLQVITASTPAPDTASLAAFARAQGMDPDAIAVLLGQPPEGVQELAHTAAPSALTNTPSGTGQALTLPPTLQGATANAIQALGNPPGHAQPSNGANEAAPDALPTAWAGGLVAWQETLAGKPASPQQQAQATTPDPVYGNWTGPARWTQALGTKTSLNRAADAATFVLPQEAGWTESEIDLSDLGDVIRPLSTALPPDAADELRGSAALTTPADLPAVARQGVASPERHHLNTGVANPLASEHAQMLSEKMADAIGERMIREIERGHWSLRLMLKPAHLGHIEVEMRLRAGELDASFMAPQAATRELLQDGLARLKEALSQMGMDVANLDVRTGQNRQNGGNPTPGQGPSATKAASAEAVANTPQSEGSPPRPHRPDGWDVMV